MQSPTPAPPPAVAVVAVSGSVLVVDRVPLGELLDATYGRLALVKVALLVVPQLVKL